MTLQKKVAIIDKETGLGLTCLADLAQSWGYAVDTMSVGKHTKPEEVSSFVANCRPNLIILAENYMSMSDISREYDVVPDMEMRIQMLNSIKRGEGIDALVKIREKDKITPIYMVSAAPHYADKALAAGANGYYVFSAPKGFSAFRELLASNLQS